MCKVWYGRRRRIGGRSVLLTYLADGSYPKPVWGLFLVSVPNWGPDGRAYEEFAVSNDVGSRLPISKIFLYHSRADPEVPFAHLGYYAEHLPATRLGQSTGRSPRSF
jgi:hypothetical protein